MALNAARFDFSCKSAFSQNTVWPAPYGVVPGLFTLRPDRCRGSVKVAQADDDDAYVSNVNHVKFSLRRGAAPDLISRYVQVFILKRFFWLELLNYCWRCCSSNGAEFVIKMLVSCVTVVTLTSYSFSSKMTLVIAPVCRKFKFKKCPDFRYDFLMFLGWKFSGKVPLICRTFSAPKIHQ